MKLISLNTWGGKLYQPLIKFIKENSENTDIFCFQEVFKTASNITEQFGFRLNLYNEAAKILGDYHGYFAPSIDNYIVGCFRKDFTNFDLSSGLATFVKKSLKIESSGNFFIYREKNNYNLNDFNTMPRNTQYVLFTKRGKKFTICNLHGIWHTGGKEDTLSRIQQSQKIKNFLDSQDGEKILCGDFNLSLNTESLKILDETMTNLIKKFNILTTRNKHFPGSEKFADYTFVSNDINVKSFQVPDINISDHLPMILEFS